MIKINDLVKLSIYITIIIIFTFTPQTGYIYIGPIAITTIPIFVSIATYHLGFKGAITSSVSFAIFSYIASITIYPSPFSHLLTFFVPRIILGFIVYGIYKFLGKFDLWKFIFLSFCSFFFNTLLVIGGIFLVSSYSELYQGTLHAFLILIYLNIIFELSFSIILSFSIFQSISFLKKKQKNEFKNKW